MTEKKSKKKSGNLHNIPVTYMRRFHLIRDTDVSGVSGTGVVAEGVEFSAGQCVITWLTSSLHATGIYDNIKTLEEIHGHEGATRVVFLDE